MTAVLLIMFGGVTDRLIPLYAVGAFLAFTLSQVGMVMHWRNQRGRGATSGMIVNGLGAAVTAITAVIVTVSKFAEGAWVTTLLIAGIMVLMLSIRRHYNREQMGIANAQPLDLSALQQPIVVVPILEWDRIARKGLSFALSLSEDIRVLHIDCGEGSERLREDWNRFVERGLWADKIALIHRK